MGGEAGSIHSRQAQDGVDDRAIRCGEGFLFFALKHGDKQAIQPVNLPKGLYECIIRGVDVKMTRRAEEILGISSVPDFIKQD